MKNILKTSSKILLLLFALTLVNCEKDDEINTDNTTKSKNHEFNVINLEDLKSKLNSKTFNFIKSNLKTKSNNNLRIINSTDNSFSVSTDDILELETDYSLSYTFNVLVKISDEHTFEQFIIQKIGAEYSFFILGFTYDSQLSNNAFPYTMEKLEISDDYIDISEFLTFMETATMYWAGGCLWVNDYDEECTCYQEVKIWCPDGSGGYNSWNNNPSDGGQNGDDSWSPPEDNDNHFPEDVGTSSGGATPAPNNEEPAPFAINNFVPYSVQIMECFLGYNSTNGSTIVNDWLNNPNTKDIDKKPIANYLNQNVSGNPYDDSQGTNCNNPEALAFAEKAIEAINEGGEVDFEDQIIFHESFDDYPCQKNIIDGVYQKDTTITNLFQNIFDNGDTHNIFFIANPNWNGLGGTLQQPSNINNYGITFGNGALNGSDLLIAITVVHEALHANLSHIFTHQDGFIISGLAPGETPTYLQLVYGFMESQVGTGPEVEHTFMQNYRAQIAQAAYIWATTSSPDGGGYPSNDNTLLLHLEHLAWAGLMTIQGSLESTPEWNYVQTNTPILADQIEAVVKAEISDPSIIYFYGSDGTQYDLENIKKGTLCD